jgi:hypothetical protein
MHRTPLIGLLLLLCVVGAGPLRAQAPRWVVTNRWQGFGSQQTEMFWVNGDAWRIRYRPSGKGFFQIVAYDAQGKYIDTVTNQNLDVPGAGSTSLRGRGQRYLGISGVDTTWEIILEQRVSVIEEWHLRQLLQQPWPQLLKIGLWTGSDGQSEYTFTVPSRSWQVRHSHSGEGRLQIMVADEAGFVVLGANEVRSAEGKGWVHKAGTFTLRVNAEQAEWKVEVLCEDTPAAGE